jgi:Fe2+ transport system protein FeoA
MGTLSSLSFTNQGSGPRGQVLHFSKPGRNSLLMVLRELPENGSAVIVGYGAQLSEIHRVRLIELGFAIGQAVRCSRKAPFGGPDVYEIADGLFSLERELSEAVEIQTRST